MINMLPATYRRQQMLRNRSTQWATAIAAVLVAGWGWHWLEIREQAQLTQQLDVLSREHAPTRTMLKQVVEMRRQLKDLDHQERVAKELETQRNALTLLGVISDNAQKAQGRLRVTKLELTSFQNAGQGGDAAASGPAPGGLVLAGVSLDASSVAELSEGLQHAGIFSKVALKTLKEREGTVLRDFEVRCEF
jgi:hypothetical protein